MEGGRAEVGRYGVRDVGRKVGMEAGRAEVGRYGRREIGRVGERWVWWGGGRLVGVEVGG